MKRVASFTSVRIGSQTVVEQERRRQDGKSRNLSLIFHPTEQQEDVLVPAYRDGAIVECHQSGEAHYQDYVGACLTDRDDAREGVKELDRERSRSSQQRWQSPTWFIHCCRRCPPSSRPWRHVTRHLVMSSLRSDLFLWLFKCPLSANGCCIPRWTCQ